MLCFIFQVANDIGMDATDEQLKEYTWKLLKSGQVRIHANIFVTGYPD